MRNQHQAGEVLLSYELLRDKCSWLCGPHVQSKSYPQAQSPSVRDNEEMEFPLQIFIASEGRIEHPLKEKKCYHIRGSTGLWAAAAIEGARHSSLRHLPILTGQRGHRKLSSNQTQGLYGKYGLREQETSSDWGVDCPIAGLCLCASAGQSKRSKLTTVRVPGSSGTEPHNKLCHEMV